MPNSIKNLCKHPILCDGLLLLWTMLCIVSCKTDKFQDPGSSEISGKSSKSSTSTETTWTPWVAVSNNTAGTLEIYHVNQTAWNTSTINWSFKPTTALGYSSGAITALGGGFGDQRLHYTTGFPNKAESACALQGGRWIGIATYIPLGSYVKGQKLWEKTYSTSDDPNNHAVELLPDGNLAVAAYGAKVVGKGDWIRIYNTSSPSVTNDFAETYLLGAHAVLWDPAYNLLWAGGRISIAGVVYHGIFAYVIGGTRANPTITEDTTRRSLKTWRNAANPDGFRYPHDISPDFDDDNKLIYSDHTGVYIYDKIAKTFTRAPGASGRYVAPADDVLIKSAGQQAADGKYVISEVDPSACPYTTNKVAFYDGITGAFAFNRSVSGCRIYRARIWTHYYQ